MISLMNIRRGDKNLEQKLSDKIQILNLEANINSNPLVEYRSQVLHTQILPGPGLYTNMFATIICTPDTPT